MQEISTCNPDVSSVIVLKIWFFEKLNSYNEGEKNKVKRKKYVMGYIVCVI